MEINIFLTFSNCPLLFFKIKNGKISIIAFYDSSKEIKRNVQVYNPKYIASPKIRSCPLIGISTILCVRNKRAQKNSDGLNLQAAVSEDTVKQR
jgi:hypothetical protein